MGSEDLKEGLLCRLLWCCFWVVINNCLECLPWWWLTSVLHGRERRRDTFSNLRPAFGKWGRKQIFLSSLLLDCLWLKVILMPTWYICGWHILVPFKSSHDSWNRENAAAAAESLQSCPTLCDPTDGSPPSSPTPGSLQARTLKWAAISFSNR